jgi:hypothetical protein
MAEDPVAVYGYTPSTTNILPSSRPSLNIASILNSGADFDPGLYPTIFNISDCSAAFAAAFASKYGTTAVPGNYQMYNNVIENGKNGLSIIALDGGPAEPSTPQTPISGKVNIIDYRTLPQAIDLFNINGSGISLEAISFFSENSLAGAGTAYFHFKNGSGSTFTRCNFVGGGLAGTAGLTDIGLLLDGASFANIWASTFQGANTDNLLIKGSGTDNIDITGINVRQSSGNAIHMENIGGGPISILGGNYTNCLNALNIDCHTVSGFNGSVAVYGGQYDSCSQYMIAMLGQTTNEYVRYARFYGSGIENESTSNLCYGIYATAQLKDIMFQSCSINRAYYDNVYINEWTPGQTAVTFADCTNYNPNYAAGGTPYSCFNIAANCVLVLDNTHFGYSSDYQGSATGTNYGINFSALQNGGWTWIKGGSAIALSSIFNNLSNAFIGPTLGRYSRITDLMGYNPVGWNASTIIIGASGTYYKNPNLVPCDVYVTGVGSGVTAVNVEDEYGNTKAFTVSGLTQGSLGVSLDVGESIGFTYSTTAPTIALKGR